MEREKGSEPLSSLPFLSLNHHIVSLGEEPVEVVEERVKVSFPLFFSPWSQMFLLEIPEDFSVLLTAESDSLALNKYPLKND